MPLRFLAKVTTFCLPHLVDQSAPQISMWPRMEKLARAAGRVAGRVTAAPMMASKTG
jgi:hypothetical protein